MSLRLPYVIHSNVLCSTMRTFHSKRSRLQDSMILRTSRLAQRAPQSVRPSAAWRTNANRKMKRLSEGNVNARTARAKLPTKPNSLRLVMLKSKSSKKPSPLDDGESWSFPLPKSGRRSLRISSRLAKQERTLNLSSVVAQKPQPNF